MLSRFFTVLQDLLTGVRSDPSLGTFSVSLLEWLHVLGEREDSFAECAQRLLSSQFVSGQDYEAVVVNAGGQQSGMGYTIGARPAAMLARESQPLMAHLAEDKKTLLNNYCRLFVTQSMSCAVNSSAANCPKHTYPASSSPSSFLLPPFSPPPLSSPPFSALAAPNRHGTIYPPPFTPGPLASSVSGSLQPNNGGVFASSADATDMRVQALERQLREATEAARQQHEEHMQMMQSLLAQSTHQDNTSMQRRQAGQGNGRTGAVAVFASPEPSANHSFSAAARYQPQRQAMCLASERRKKRDQEKPTPSSPCVSSSSSSSSSSLPRTSNLRSVTLSSVSSTCPESPTISAAYTQEQLHAQGAAFFASDRVVFGDPKVVYVPADELRRAFVSYTNGAVPASHVAFKRLLRWLRDEKGHSIEVCDNRKEKYSQKRVWRGASRQAVFVGGVDLKEGRGGNTSERADNNGQDISLISHEQDDESASFASAVSSCASSVSSSSSSYCSTSAPASSSASSTAASARPDFASDTPDVQQRLHEKANAFFASDRVVFGNPSKVYVPSDELRRVFVSYAGLHVSSKAFRQLLLWLQKKQSMKMTVPARSEFRHWRCVNRCARFVCGVDIAEGRETRCQGDRGRDSHTGARSSYRAAAAAARNDCKPNTESDSPSSSPSSPSSSSSDAAEYQPKRQRTGPRASVCHKPIAKHSDSHKSTRSTLHSSNYTHTMTDAELFARGQEFFRSNSVVFGDCQRTFVPIGVLKECFCSFTRARCAPANFRRMLEWLVKNSELCISVGGTRQKETLWYRGERKEGYVWVRGVDVVQRRGEGSASTLEEEGEDREREEENEEEESYEEAEKDDEGNGEEEDKVKEAAQNVAKEKKAREKQDIVGEAEQKTDREAETRNTETERGELEDSDDSQESERTDSEDESENEWERQENN